jgi:hypothetical protein
MVKTKSISCCVSNVSASFPHVTSLTIASATSSSTASSIAASCSDHPGASAPARTRSISSSAMPAPLAMTTCCSHS